MERVWFKIGEAARRIGATPKDLRYWERVIPEIKPRRSLGNLRYYHADELPRLARIRGWIEEGLTVADCRQLMLTGSLTRPLELDLPEEELTRAPVPPRPRPRRDLAPLKAALEALLRRLEKPPAQAGHRAERQGRG